MYVYSVVSSPRSSWCSVVSCSLVGYYILYISLSSIYIVYMCTKATTLHFGIR